jgi:hypothetical protein
MVSYNRRRHRRVTAKGLVVQLQTGDGALQPCLVENLSTGGVFLRTSELSPVGALIQLTVTRPGMKKSLRITGRVASAIDTTDLVGMGVEFQSVDPEDVSKLAALLVELGAVEARSLPPPRPDLATAPAHSPNAAASAPMRAAVTSPANAVIERGASAPTPSAAASRPAPAREGGNATLADKRIKALQEELAKARATVEEKDKALARFRTELDRVRFELKTKDEQLLRLGAKKH